MYTTSRRRSTSPQDNCASSSQASQVGCGNRHGRDFVVSAYRSRGRLTHITQSCGSSCSSPSQLSTPYFPPPTSLALAHPHVLLPSPKLTRNRGSRSVLSSVPSPSSSVFSLLFGPLEPPAGSCFLLGVFRSDFCRLLFLFLFLLSSSS